MEPEKRINKDLKIFEENIIPVEELELSDEEVQVKEMAKRYYEDTKYYFKIEDFLTSFACIAYAHGLLDSLRIMHDLIEDS
ncbi:MAG: DUF357 domain-containing protein [Methanosphaera sp.]|uniref:DUF357 domain-containing protein n=1 Tax=Methanosphaera sp. TaxID=2666342 RepID=UPI0025F1D0E1|nr:DUF357 domain-containing protein [Methanosphaera sp.]MCI5867665.1 DUF357 domain-containing protein [Methanosphaera sp.]MDD6534133.1 DUF357 domain-containing protein [Methanosphaera sp.]MDY3956058.1 DUF357 domain-containing protein [Methanosphaera sp.]